MHRNFMKNTVKQVGIQCLKFSLSKNEFALDGILNWVVISKQLPE